MKKSFQLFLLFFSTLLSAQTYNNPLILFRHNKSAAITSIQILPKSIKVDLEYLGSAKYMDGWISISQGTKLTTQDGLSAKIIKGENIAFSPQKTPTVKNKIQKFSLYFEKIEDLKNKRFSIIEDSKSFTAFNFWDIKLENNENPSENNIPKYDFFITQIPQHLQFLYYYEYFIESHFDSKEFFNKLIEVSQEEKIPQISGIHTEDIDFHNKNAFAYTLITDLPTSKISSYYYVKDEDGKRINHIMIYFTTKEDAEKFFTSITSWYGAGLDGKSALKIDASKKNMYAILFNLSERYGNNMVDIDVLTWEEYKSLINSKK